MRKSLISFFILLVLTASAVSQTIAGLQSPSSQYWRYVTSSNDGKVDFYAILKTHEGDIRELWEKAVDADYAGVVVTLKKYDCESGASRLIHMTIYTGSEITTNESYDDTQWQFSKPNTVGNALLKLPVVNVNANGLTWARALMKFPTSLSSAPYPRVA